MDEANSMEPIRSADGEDLTETIRILCDIAHNSMDWGSGFLDNEEMEAVISLCVKMGWNVPPIPSNSYEQMASVVRKFPDHYEVVGRTTRIHTSGCNYYTKPIPDRTFDDCSPWCTNQTYSTIQVKERSGG